MFIAADDVTMTSHLSG